MQITPEELLRFMLLQKEMTLADKVNPEVAQAAAKEMAAVVNAIGKEPEQAR
jgi:hypothetical protein